MEVTAATALRRFVTELESQGGDPGGDRPRDLVDGVGDLPSGIFQTRPVAEPLLQLRQVVLLHLVLSGRVTRGSGQYERHTDQTSAEDRADRHRTAISGWPAANIAKLYAVIVTRCGYRLCPVTPLRCCPS